MADMSRKTEALPLQAYDGEHTLHIDYGFARESIAWDAEIMQGE